MVLQSVCLAERKTRWDLLKLWLVSFVDETQINYTFQRQGGSVRAATFWLEKCYPTMSFADICVNSLSLWPNRLSLTGAALSQEDELPSPGCRTLARTKRGGKPQHWCSSSSLSQLVNGVRQLMKCSELSFLNSSCWLLLGKGNKTFTCTEAQRSHSNWTMEPTDANLCGWKNRSRILRKSSLKVN